jgi:hypothetical protein
MTYNFLRAYRADGHGHPAYDPKTLLGVLLYARSSGSMSSITTATVPTGHSGCDHQIRWPAGRPRRG